MSSRNLPAVRALNLNGGRASVDTREACTACGIGRVLVESNAFTGGTFDVCDRCGHIAPIARIPASAYVAPPEPEVTFTAEERGPARRRNERAMASARARAAQYEWSHVTTGTFVGSVRDLAARNDINPGNFETLRRLIGLPNRAWRGWRWVRCVSGQCGKIHRPSTRVGKVCEFVHEDGRRYVGTIHGMVAAYPREQLASSSLYGITDVGRRSNTHRGWSFVSPAQALLEHSNSAQRVG